MTKDSLKEGELIRIPNGCHKIRESGFDINGTPIWSSVKIDEGTIATFLGRDIAKENLITSDSYVKDRLMICAKLLINGRDLCHAFIPYHRDFYQ